MVAPRPADRRGANTLIIRENALIITGGSRAYPYVNDSIVMGGYHFCLYALTSFHLRMDTSIVVNLCVCLYALPSFHLRMNTTIVINLCVDNSFQLCLNTLNMTGFFMFLSVPCSPEPF